MARRDADRERGGFEPVRRPDGLDKLTTARQFRREAQESRNREGRRKHRAKDFSTWG